jgi:hypothetical protein
LPASPRKQQRRGDLLEPEGVVARHVGVGPRHAKRGKVPLVGAIGDLDGLRVAPQTVEIVAFVELDGDQHAEPKPLGSDLVVQHIVDVCLIGSDGNENGLARGIATEQQVPGVGDLRGDLAVALAEQLSERVGIRVRGVQRR